MAASCSGGWVIPGSACTKALGGGATGCPNIPAACACAQNMLRLKPGPVCCCSTSCCCCCCCGSGTGACLAAARPISYSWILCQVASMSGQAPGKVCPEFYLAKQQPDRHGIFRTTTHGWLGTLVNLFHGDLLGFEGSATALVLIGQAVQQCISFSPG